MTISLQQNGATRSAAAVLSGTSAVDVYTAPTNGALLSTINIANTTASAVTTTVKWYRAANTTAYTIRNWSLAANAREQIDLPIEMAAGDKIQVTQGTSPSLVVIVTAVARTGTLV